MAWNDGVDRATGYIVTAGNWNNYLGATGSLMYLKTEADKHDDVTTSQPTRVVDTTYQNTTGKIKFVTIICPLDNGEEADVLIGSTSTPTTIVGYMLDSGAANYTTGLACFTVPVSWYYKLRALTGTITIYKWTECDIL